VRDLRISVTDRCNFRCTYCMPEEGMQWLPRSEILTFEEIERLARICVERFGFDGIRLTGGEPTVRAHITRLVEQARRARRRPGDDDQRRDAAPLGPRSA
jgi:GTP 3',8-cyclase